MKKALFTAALLCMISVFAKAQITQLNIVNSTSGDVYIEFNGATTLCGITNSSGFITFPPGVTNIDASIISGLNTGDYISVIKVISDIGGGTCQPFYSVLFSDCGFPGAVPTATPSTAIPDFYDGSCNPTSCSSIELSMPSGGVSDLTFL